MTATTGRSAVFHSARESTCSQASAGQSGRVARALECCAVDRVSRRGGMVFVLCGQQGSGRRGEKRQCLKPSFGRTCCRRSWDEDRIAASVARDSGNVCGTRCGTSLSPLGARLPGRHQRPSKSSSCRSIWLRGDGRPPCQPWSHLPCGTLSLAGHCYHHVIFTNPGIVGEADCLSNNAHHQSKSSRVQAG